MYTTKEQAIKKLNKGENFCLREFDLFRNNFGVVKHAVSLNSEFYSYCDESMKENIEIALIALNDDKFRFFYVPNSIKHNKQILNVVKDLLENGSYVLSFEAYLILEEAREEFYKLNQ